MATNEFTTWRAAIDGSDEMLATELGISEARLRALEAGSKQPTAKELKMLAWLADDSARTRALGASGLAECPWMTAFDARTIPNESDAFDAHFAALDEHVAKCAACQARDAFVASRFGPQKPPPSVEWVKWFAWIDRVPAILRPATVGAALLAAMVLVRVVFKLPAIIRDPSLLGPLGIAVLAAAAAGAVGGLAYSLTRPNLKRLGVVGDYLTGVVCVFAYMGSLAVAAPYAFGRSLLDDRAGVVAFTVVSLFFGLVVGHYWFRPDKPTPPSRS